jgi:hypothetical protein
MQPTSQTISKSRLWTGRTISSILVLFLLFDAIAKLLRLAPVLQAFDQLGWSRSLSIPIGIVLLTCTILYAVPYTSALGALLLTTYLWGSRRDAPPRRTSILFCYIVWHFDLGRASVAQ